MPRLFSFAVLHLGGPVEAGLLGFGSGFRSLDLLVRFIVLDSGWIHGFGFSDSIWQLVRQGLGLMLIRV